MIVITEKKNEISVEGHAGYSEHGTDIICAGISSLFQTLIYSILDLTEDQIEYNLAHGKAYIKYNQISKETGLLVRSFFIGVESIAYTYPECVSVLR